MLRRTSSLRPAAARLCAAAALASSNAALAATAPAALPVDRAGPDLSDTVVAPALDASTDVDRGPPPGDAEPRDDLTAAPPGGDSAPSASASEAQASPAAASPSASASAQASPASPSGAQAGAAAGASTSKPQAAGAGSGHEAGAEHEAGAGHEPAAAQHAGHGGGHSPRKLVITPGGYLEFFYSHNFNRPENNITALRGFDFLNGSLTVGNFVMSLDAAYGGFSTRLALNVGANPSQFYEQEPATTPSYQVPALDRHTWSFIQEALVGWSPRRAPGLTFQVGVMATPIGIEGLANYQTWRGSMASPHMLPKDYRENWNWSRSNAFINVPDYHSGVRVLYSINKKHHLGAFLLNGQNMLTDNNDGKTISLTYLWMPSARAHMSVVYMGGPERPRGAPEGQGWRHLIDYTARWEATRNLHFMTQFVPGFERTRFGINMFLINVVYASWKFKRDIRLAFRYEHLLEKVAPGSSTVFLRGLNDNNTAALFGYTGTLSVPLVPNHLMVRLEYRHDRSPLRWFYKGKLEESGDPHAPYLPNARYQNTVTVGVVGWF